MTDIEDFLEERLNEACNELEDAKVRIKCLERDLSDMTVLAGDYKAWAQRLEAQVREATAEIEALKRKAQVETGHDHRLFGLAALR